MSNQEIFDSLSELEETLYYRMHNPGNLDFQTLSAVHESINAALRLWHRLTGCKNQ